MNRFSSWDLDCVEHVLSFPLVKYLGLPANTKTLSRRCHSVGWFVVSTLLVGWKWKFRRFYLFIVMPKKRGSIINSLSWLLKVRVTAIFCILNIVAVKDFASCKWRTKWSSGKPFKGNFQSLHFILFTSFRLYVIHSQWRFECKT